MGCYKGEAKAELQEGSEGKVEFHVESLSEFGYDGSTNESVNFMEGLIGIMFYCSIDNELGEEKLEGNVKVEVEIVAQDFAKI